MCIYYGLKYRFCVNFNKIYLVLFALAFGPHNDNNYIQTSLLKLPFWALGSSKWTLPLKTLYQFF